MGLTPRQLAEKIWNDTVNTVTAEEFIPIAESLLAEAMEEAKLQTKSIMNGMIRSAKAAAYEDAAKIAETVEGRYHGCPDCGSPDQEEIADAIRQRAKEIK